MASKLDLNELIAKRRQEYLASQSAPPQPPAPPKEQLVQLPLTQLEDFPADRHPFRPGSDSRIQQLRQDIVLNGVLSPLLVRSLGQGHYQILAGHNRKRAAALANYTKVPCIIRDVNEDEAVNIMLSDNLMQRDDLLPSEKAFAYKMKLEAMKRTAGRPRQDNSVQLGQNFGQTSREALALQSPDSNSQIQRYIRLTELIPALLEKVDEQAIGLTIGCTLSYLTDAAQEVVYQHFFAQHPKLHIDQRMAEELRKTESEGQEEITAELLEELVQARAGSTGFRQVKVPMKNIRRFFQPNVSKEEVNQTIEAALEFYYTHRQLGTSSQIETK